ERLRGRSLEVRGSLIRLQIVKDDAGRIPRIARGQRPDGVIAARTEKAKRIGPGWPCLGDRPTGPTELDNNVVQRLVIIVANRAADRDEAGCESANEILTSCI